MLILLTACSRDEFCARDFARGVRGGRRSPNRADIARHGAVSCCAHCVRAVHRTLRRWCEHSIFFLAVVYTYVYVYEARISTARRQTDEFYF